MSANLAGSLDVRPGPRPVTPLPDPPTAEVAELRRAIEDLRAEVAALRKSGIPVSVRDVDLSATACMRQAIVGTFGILVAGALLAVPTAIVLIVAGYGSR